MAQYCEICNQITNCTDDCRECLEEESNMNTKEQVKEMYRDLKGMCGRSEYVSEEAIRNDLGDRAFEMLREHGYIEYCTTIQGRKMYAV